MWDAMRPRLPRLVAAFLAVFLALPATGVASAASDGDLRRNQDKLRQARQGLATTEAKRKATVADLAQIEARRAQFEGELAALNQTLASAQSLLNAAEAKLREVQGAYDRAELELNRTRRELARQRALYGARARETFKRGNGGAPMLALLEVRDIQEFARGMKYVERVMAHDRDRITRIAALERRVQARAAELDRLRERQELLAQAAAGERDKVAALAADQRVLRDKAAAEAERHRVALKDIEGDREQYRKLVNQLEQESSQIEGELRRRAAEERKRREQGSGGTDVPTASSGELARPYSGPQTSGYGWREHPIYGDRRFHAGVDYGGPTGAKFWSAGAGVVVSAGWRSGYGNAVVIDHGDGLATLYGHASSLFVTAGQTVKRGQPIGAIGSTGYSTGPHLHFEVRRDGEPQDPNRYV